MSSLVNSFWGGGGDFDSFKVNITTIGASESYTFPFYNIGTYTDCTIDFGDGGGEKTIATWNDANATNVYAVAGSYTITISATACAGIYFNNIAPYDERVDNILQWGTIPFNRINFFGCSNMVVTATDIPDLSNVTALNTSFTNCTSIVTIPNFNSWDISTVLSLANIFQGCTSFDQDISGWDTSNVTNFSAIFNGATSYSNSVNAWDVSSGTNFSNMFNNADAFNQSLSSWTLNVAGGITMQNMFSNTALFNQDISAWDFSKVTNMQSMFQSAVYNHSSITGWDVSNVTTMFSMFENNTAFNQAIGAWSPSSCTNMTEMFRDCNAFNQNLTGWNGSLTALTTLSGTFRDTVIFNNGGVTLTWALPACSDFNNMFNNADVFNQLPAFTLKTTGTISMITTFLNAPLFDQSLAGWDVTVVNNFSSFLSGGTLSTANYDATLIAWELLNLTDSLTVHFGSSTYSDPGAGATAKLAIETDDSWTFIDGGGV